MRRIILGWILVTVGTVVLSATGTVKVAYHHTPDTGLLGATAPTIDINMTTTSAALSESARNSSNIHICVYGANLTNSVAVLIKNQNGTHNCVFGTNKCHFLAKSTKLDAKGNPITAAYSPFISQFRAIGTSYVAGAAMTDTTAYYIPNSYIQPLTSPLPSCSSNSSVFYLYFMYQNTKRMTLSGTYSDRVTLEFNAT